MNKPPRTALPRRQRGIALITAILVVSIAVIAATAVLSAGSLAIQRTATLQETEKAWWYAIGVEAWVKTILQRDAKENKYDGLSDIWAQPVDALPVEQGVLAGRIIDEQGRFNLNNFGVTDPIVRKEWQDIFTRLFEQLKLDPALALPLSEAITDWVDADQNPTPYDGAEDNEYLALRPPAVPYRTANRLMQSVTELMAVKGINKDIYAALLPYISALPRTDVPININTAPEALVLALEVKTSSDTQSFLKERLQKPLETPGEMQTKGLFTGPGDAKPARLSVSSSYFQLRADASIGSSHVAIYCLFYRPSQGDPVVLARSTDSE
ncbi:type II secretion system minor pseudopilin GspK [Hydrocarboniphaga sp.]|uniref:type II secretion system minor pseudopilin GspK n=1 Tax=Hydrocarboniphaga sp. TaxID=2033016 RepID=UPI00263634EA|nr:type II secretion system minor pseudopilin GspK [Hydrocarboniphaga sp.]